MEAAEVCKLLSRCTKAHDDCSPAPSRVYVDFKNLHLLRCQRAKGSCASNFEPKTSRTTEEEILSISSSSLSWPKEEPHPHPHPPNHPEIRHALLQTSFAQFSLEESGREQLWLSEEIADTGLPSLFSKGLPTPLPTKYAPSTDLCHCSFFVALSLTGASSILLAFFANSIAYGARCKREVSCCTPLHFITQQKTMTSIVTFKISLCSFLQAMGAIPTK